MHTFNLFPREPASINDPGEEDDDDAAAESLPRLVVVPSPIKNFAKFCRKNSFTLR